MFVCFFFFQAEDGIRDFCLSRGLGDVYKRQDIGYVDGLLHLASVLLNSLEEYDAFNALINLTHSYHFLPCFQSDMREIGWRVTFFDQYFSKELPYLYNHFKALDLTTEIFFVFWLLTLFSSSMPIKITNRIWDNFFLEGEVFVYKVGIAILMYYELELKMATFDQAQKFLKKLPSDICEEYFFHLIDEIKISHQQFHYYLEQQNIAEINTQIHQALLR
eukprot:TRINITY_DN8548_c0_g1_i2.p1 TRINITY_DN8548_c0_g1~~TRINITY_DN8548_c0_g1_i2.p1  ORF type:complete len:219 (+),score=33.84 TRINITY_DN8548_c0_g1_i2:2-658(+)